MSVEAAPHNTGVAEGGLPAYRFDSIERAHGGRVLLDGNWRYVLGADLRRIDLFFRQGVLGSRFGMSMEG